jgi:hypothetical protein
MSSNRSFDTDAQRRSFAPLRSFPPVAGQLRRYTAHDPRGYALSYDRSPADAIREELAAALVEAGATRLSAAGWQMPRVGYFKPNDTGLFALVECFLPTENGAPILVEVVVASNGKETHATLEQVSAAV